MFERLAKYRTRGTASVPREAVKVRPLDVALTGCWLGAVVGLTELGWMVSSRRVMGQITNETLGTNWHFAWMVPVSNLGLFGGLGITLGLTAWLLPKTGVDRIAVYAFSFLAAMALVLGVPGLHTPALVALSAGIAFQVGRWVTARPGKGRWLVRRTLPVVAGVILVLTVWQWTEVSWAESRALAGSSPPPAGAPNVVLIVMDTVRADALSVYGSARDTTPNLARLARRGVRFDVARSTAPWTLPSHASLFTGRWGHELEVDVGRPLDATFPTLAEYLTGHGYATAGFVANVHNCNAWYGLSRGFSRYEDNYENTAVTPVELLRACRLGRLILMSNLGQRAIKTVMTTPKYRYRKSAAMINRDALAWLPKQGDRPFFMFLNYYDAHDPYVPPAGAARPFTRPATGGPPRDALEEARDVYDDCLAYLDDQIGRLFDELGRRGALDNTMVVITADHGEGFGEHGLSGHGVSLYRPELHVPLLVISPSRVPAGESVGVPVSLRDVPATVADLTGLGKGSPFPGGSLSRYWATAAGHHDPVLSEVTSAPLNVPNPSRVPARHGLMRSVADQGFTYILNGDGREELYDHRSDPHEQRDLAGSPDASESLTRLRGILRTLTDVNSPAT